MMCLKFLIFVLGFVVCVVVQVVLLCWVVINDVLMLDLYLQDYVIIYVILQYVYEGLMCYDVKWQIEFCFVIKWIVVLLMQMCFELCCGVKFYDGMFFIVDDVIFLFNCICQLQGMLQIYVLGIKEIRKVDDYMIDLMFDVLNFILLCNLVDFCIMSKVWVEKNKSMNIQDFKVKDENYVLCNVMGMGLYKIMLWVLDQWIMMVINKDWWDKNVGNVMELIYLLIKFELICVVVLFFGDVDLVSDVLLQDVQKFKVDLRIKMLEGNEVCIIFFVMDEGSDELFGVSVKGKNLFKDKCVCEVLFISIDCEVIKWMIMCGLLILWVLWWYWVLMVICWILISC